MALFPDSASALVDELDRMFPERVSGPDTSREDDLFHGGKRDLIKFLKEWRDRSRGAATQGAARVRR